MHPTPAGSLHRFTAGLGVAQVVSWGTLYYSFPLIAGPMAATLGLGKVEVYAAASIGLASGGLAAYPVGRLVDAGHGRAVLAGGSAFGALVLLAWSLVPSGALLLPLFVGIGIAQATSLYEPAFAVAARRFSANAREAITQLTLWGGFASTVFIPVTQWLLNHLPWREALLALSAMQLLLAATLNALVARDVPAPSLAGPPPPRKPIAGWAVRQQAFWALAISFTLYYGTFSALTLHLYPLLVERALPVESVVLVMALIGPAQVFGRVLLWKGAGALPVRWIGVGTLVTLGASVAILRFAEGFAAAVAFALLYGLAAGVMTIVRGLAIPELLSREAYGELNGMLVTPGMAARAAAPITAAWLWSIGQYALMLDVVLATTALMTLRVAWAGWARKK